MNLATFLIGFFAIASAASEDYRPDVEYKVSRNAEAPLNVDVSSDSGKLYNLKLTRAVDESVLHPNINVISLGKDESGHLSYDSWSPSKSERSAAENLYIDAENLAAVRVNVDNGNREMEGVVDGMKFVERDGRATLVKPSKQKHTDYIDIGRKLTESRQAGANTGIVETVLICDKEFGDVFQHNRQKILDYFTVYFWDINLRFKTLPSVDLSFLITGIIVIATPGGQPFIEEARASDGRAEFGRILGKFNRWAYEQMGSLPKFDMAIAITNTRLEWHGGLAYVGGTCGVDRNGRRHYGTLVFNDNGAWDSLTVGAHEIGHNVGAPHDDEDDYPGGCTDRGYIMSGGNDDLKWFFSTCSDRTIGTFVRLQFINCTRVLPLNCFESSECPPQEKQSVGFRSLYGGNRGIRVGQSR